MEEVGDLVPAGVLSDEPHEVTVHRGDPSGGAGVLEQALLVRMGAVEEQVLVMDRRPQQLRRRWELTRGQPSPRLLGHVSEEVDTVGLGDGSPILVEQERLRCRR